MDSSDQREFIRVPIQVQALVEGGGLSITSLATQNLSMKGMLVVCPERLPEGTTCMITLLLGDGAIRIQTEASVIRCYAEGIAFQFTRILGLESFEHLQKLLLYNAPDPDQVEHEFQDATGIHRKE